MSPRATIGNAYNDHTELHPTSTTQPTPPHR